MKISCIIPVYNTSRFLKKCVDSVLNQTYTDYEIILVNDCSTDNSADICRKYQALYPNKIFFIDKPINEGVDKARFTGLYHVLQTNKCGGVTFVDSDDYIENDSFRRMADEMIRTKCDVVQMRATRVWGLIKRAHFAPIEPQIIDQPILFDKYFISFFGVNLLDVWMCSKLYRVETLANAELKPSCFKMGEDLMFNMKLFPYYKRYALIDYKGYNYRVGGITSRYNPSLWEDLKRQYWLKRDFAHQYNYLKANRTLNIELKNIFISCLCQRIIYLRECRMDLSKWLTKELNETALWNDICIMAKTEKDAIYSYIANKDTEAIIDEAHKRLYATRWRRRAKKILSFMFR